MNDISIWDNIAKTYDSHTYNEENGSYPANRYRADRVIDFLKTLKPGKILDAGGGTGYVAARVAELGWQVYYFDASTAMQQVAKAATNGQLAGYEQGSIANMHCYEDQSFDVVMMNGVLPYLSESEEPAAYREAQRVLKNDGYFIAAHYNQLFDLMEMDAYTAEFFASVSQAATTAQTASRLREILSTPESTESRSMKVENPLTFTNKLQQFGFKELKRHYYNFHILPPRIEHTTDNTARAKIELAHHADWQGIVLARAFFVIAQKGE